jgi:hypothetical protein
LTGRVEITHSGDTDPSDNYAAVDIEFAMLAAGTQTNFPLSGDPAEMRVVAGNAAAVTSYTWESSVDNGVTWTTIAGATTDACTHTATVDGELVRCTALWDSGCSDAAVFRFAAPPDNVVDEPCIIPATQLNWSIDGANPIKLGSNEVSVYQTAYVGDLDGPGSDGSPEIVVATRFI